MSDLVLDDLEKIELVRSEALKLFKNDDEYRELRSQFHPDRFPFCSPEQARAEKVFKKLEQLWELAKEPSVVLKSKTAEYTLGDQLGKGDVSDIFRASSGACHDYVVKVSNVPGGDMFVSLESQYLKRFTGLPNDKKTYEAYFPQLVDSFLWKDGFQKRVNVFLEPRRLWSLADVLAKKGLLDPRHICWITRRTLTALGFAHRQGIVHGAVLPQHILIDPEGHGVVLGGWIHATTPGRLITTVPASHKDWYPSEVKDHKSPGPGTDLYLLGKSMLAAGDWGTNQRIHRLQLFLESMTLDRYSMRPTDAWQIEEDFTILMDAVYGVRRFIPLSM